jgi:molecular chaperone HtpG
MEKGNISVQAENIFPIIKKFLYSDHDIFLRELVSNAVDATTKVKALALKGDLKSELGDTTIEIILDKEAKTLTIKDKGIGMSEAEVKKYLNQVAFSSAEDFLKKFKDESIIGHFGLGFYSAFMVAEKVDVITKSYKKTVKAVKWSCEGDPSYEMESHSKKERGTEIVLHIAEDSLEFLEEARIAQLLNKYCKFLPVAIKFGTKEDSVWEGEGEEKKEVKSTVDNIINNTAPAWTKKPTELSDEDYKNFYQELYPNSPEPLFWIHLNIDFPFDLTGILYFPKLNNSLEIQKNKIQLYSNQVFVTDDVKEIVPEFLTLLHGVIDSTDIPLNVSRSYLQSDSNVKKITSYITKKVAEKLSKLFKKERENYESKWSEIGVFVKYGIISDEKFYEKAVKFALFQALDGKFYTMDEYKEHVKEAQTDKNGKIIYLYAQNAKEQHSFIESAKTAGYDVLIMDNVIDNHFMQHIEFKDQDIRFVRVDSETVDQLIQKEEVRESVMSEKDQEKVKALFETAIENKATTIDMKPLSPEDHPILITKPEFMRRMQEMQSLQGNKDGFGDFFNVVINTNHPLVADKLVRMKSAEKKDRFAQYLYDLARLNQNMLKGEELSQFIKSSLDFVN